MKARILTLFPLLTIIALGCGHAQLPPTPPHGVAISGTAPSVCTAASPCTFVFSRAVLSSATAQCPPTNSTTNYTPINSDAPTSSVSYDDLGGAGQVVCYVAQTKQGTSISVASNAIGPYTVLPNLQAPTLNPGQISKVEPSKPMLSPVGNLPAPVLTAKLIPVR